MGREVHVHLNEGQQSVLFRIQARPELLSDFEVLCASFEAALDEVERPVDLEKTDPLGVVAIRSSIERTQIEITEVATVVAVAWLEMIASAIAEAGEINAVMFDDDGVSIFGDTQALFAVAKDCGIGPAHARRAFARVRGESKTAPRRALKLLRGIGAIPVRTRPTSRIVALKPCFAAQLDRGEIARAKAGSVYYSLVAMEGGYGAFRVRKRKALRAVDEGSDVLDFVSETDADLMDGFSVPLFPCEELHPTALAHFVQFLEGADERKPRNTYQRIVHRASAA
jgi:hypothetical protein